MADGPGIIDPLGKRLKGDLTFEEGSLQFSANNKLEFRDTGIFIQSDSDGRLLLDADGGNTDDIKLNAPAQFASGHRVAQTTQSGDYTATVDDYIIGIDDTSAARTVTLPSAGAVAGKVFIVNDESGAASSNGITVATEGSENIDGSSTQSISTNNGTIRVYSDGANYFTF